MFVLFLATLDKLFPKIGKSRVTIFPDCIILENWAFENFILADQPFAKALKIFETFVSVNNNLCGKLVSWLEFPIKFDERFKVTSVSFFITYFNAIK